MPASQFNKLEATFLCSYIERWSSLAGTHSEHGEVPPRTVLVRKVIEDFFTKFPGRVPGSNDPEVTPFAEDVYQDMPRIIAQWFTNKTRHTAPLNTAKSESATKRVTGRTLAIQQHREEINSRMQELKILDPTTSQMALWNKAANEVVGRIETETPEEFKRLKDQAADIRAAESLDYTEQSPEAIQRLLSAMPKTLVRQIDDWSRTTGAVFYLLALYEFPGEPGLKTIDVMSPTIARISSSAQGEKARELIVDWVLQELGATLSRDPNKAERTVFPNKYEELRPLMPVVEDLKEISRDTLRNWIREFLVALWKWQGGRGAPPWGRLSADLEYHLVKCHRLPPGISSVEDPGKHTVETLLKWYHHLLKQDGNRFQFRQVLAENGHIVATYDSLCVTRHPGSTLRWSPEAKSYALYVDSQPTASGGQRAWKSLPLARTEGVYAPFSPNVLEDLGAVGLKHIDIVALARLVNELEVYGPSHAEDVQQLSEPLNANFPRTLDNESFNTLAVDQFLPLPFFDQSHDDHSGHAMSTLAHWMKTSRRFRHAASDTWRGGPSGVRWNVAMISCVATSMSLIDLGIRVPPDIQKVFDPAVQLRLWQQVNALATWLSQSLQRSIQSLKDTYPARSDAWKQAVLSQAKQFSRTRFISSTRSSPALEVTSGLPLDPTEVHAYAQKLIQTGVVLTLATPEPTPQSDSELQSSVPESSSGALDTQLRLQRPKRSAKEDESEENFDLDNISLGSTQAHEEVESSSDEHSVYNESIDSGLGPNSVRMDYVPQIHHPSRQSPHLNQPLVDSSTLAAPQDSDVKSAPLSTQMAGSRPTASTSRRTATRAQGKTAQTEQDGSQAQTAPRPRRNVQQSAAAKEAIRTARKGRFVPP